MAWELIDNIRGPKGEKGDTGTIAAASVTTLPPGTPASVAMTGPTAARSVAFGIPKGDKGDQGVAGTLSSASAESVPAGEPAAVIMSGTSEVKHAHFKVPRGLPALNAEADDEVVATYVDAVDTDTRAAVTRVIREQAPAVDLRRDFGAVGDGFADDTAAVQSFFDYLAANGGAGIAEGTFRLTTTVNIFDPVAAFTFTGSGKHTCRFVADHAVSSNVFGLRSVNAVRMERFSVDGGSPAMTQHGISAANCTDTTIEDVEVSNYAGTPILFYKHALFTGLPTRNHIVRCVALGGGVAANGFLLEKSSFSTMRDVEVYSLDRNAGPSYAIQLKNDCTSCIVSGGIVDGARVGVAFGYDDAATGSHTDNIVVGVTVRNCYQGFLGSRMIGNTIQLNVDMMADAASTHAVYLAGNANANTIDVAVRRPASAATIIYVQDDYNTITLTSLDAIGAARLAEFAATAVGNTLIVGGISDRTSTNTSAVPVTDAGSSNRIRFMANDELHASADTASRIRFTSPTNQNTWVQYTHTTAEYRMRAAGVDILTATATQVAPGVQDAQSLGHPGRRWTEGHFKNGVIINSSDGSAWRITVSNAGAIVATKIV